MSEIISELQKISADTQTTFGKLSPTQINWKPSAEGWSVGQCFEHLIKTNELFYGKLAVNRHTVKFRGFARIEKHDYRKKVDYSNNNQYN